MNDPHRGDLARRAYEMRAAGRNYRDIARELGVDNPAALIAELSREGGPAAPVEPTVRVANTPETFYALERFGHFG